MAKESNPSATQPSTSITLNNAKAYEVGTEFTPTYSVGFNEGSYTYGPNTGVTVSEYSVTDTAEGYAATQTGSFIKFIVEDTTNYKVKVTVKHTAGTTPKTNLGNDYAAVQIQAGSKSAESSVVTGYRNSFYGTFTETKELNSDNIRTLTKSNKALSNTNTFTITVPVGAKRVVFAYPSTLRDVNSVKDVNGLNAEISSGFTKVLVDVEGFDKYTAKEYKVYYMDFANPNDKANSYTVVI
jgi:hypothetical protein